MVRKINMFWLIVLPDLATVCVAVWSLQMFGTFSFQSLEMLHLTSLLFANTTHQYFTLLLKSQHKQVLSIFLLLLKSSYLGFIRC